MRRTLCVLRQNVLNRLSMTSRDVDTHNTLSKRGVGGLYEIVIQVLFVSKRIEAFENEFKECLQVLRTGRSDKNVCITHFDGSCDSYTHGSRFTATARGGERNC